MPAASSQPQGKPLLRAVFALRMVRTPSTTSQAPMKIPMAAAMGAGAAISSTPRTTARTPRTMTTQNTPLLTECRSDRAWSRGSGTPDEYRGSLGVSGDDIANQGDKGRESLQSTITEMSPGQGVHNSTYERI